MFTEKHKPGESSQHRCVTRSQGTDLLRALKSELLRASVLWMLFVSVSLSSCGGSGGGGEGEELQEEQPQPAAAPGAWSAEMELREDGRLYMPAVINGVSTTCLIDTGASVFWIGELFAEEVLGLEAFYETLSGPGVGGHRSRLKLFRLDTLEVGATKQENVERWGIVLSHDCLIGLRPFLGKRLEFNLRTTPPILTVD